MANEGTPIRLIQKRIVEFIKKNPYPSDDQFHAFAQGLGVDEHIMEQAAYALISDIFAQGKADEQGKESLPKKEIQKGVDVEKEHTSNPMIAREIAEDHEVESKNNNYYEKLDEMEKEMKAEDKMAMLQNKLAKVLCKKKTKKPQGVQGQIAKKRLNTSR